MSNIIPFQFEKHSVRVVTDDNGEPLFVDKDICDALGYADHTNAMKQHCKGVVKRHPLQTPGGMQELRVLSEPDVFRLTIKSELPGAERFEAWVFEEVLPSIRKTGAYAMPGVEFALPAPLILFKSAKLAECLRRGMKAIPVTL
jgi:prophage antirepressor-like protein